MIRVAHAIK